MNTLVLTNHAVLRMAQRGIHVKDADLITLIGTEVDQGYLVRTKDCQEVERELKSFLERVWRVCGKLLIAEDGRVVTAYHPSRQDERRLLREM